MLYILHKDFPQRGTVIDPRCVVQLWNGFHAKPRGKQGNAKITIFFNKQGKTLQIAQLFYWKWTFICLIFTFSSTHFQLTVWSNSSFEVTLHLNKVKEKTDTCAFAVRFLRTQQMSYWPVFHSCHIIAYDPCICDSACFSVHLVRLIIFWNSSKL